MALSDDDFVQTNTGTTTASSTVAPSLPSGTTAGNTVFVFMRIGGSTTVSAMPAGFEVATANLVYYKSNVGAGETSWSFTLSASNECAWVAVEMSNIDASPFEALSGGTGTNVALGNGTLATSTSSYNVGLSSVTFGVFASTIGAATTKSWGSFTNGFTEVAQVDATAGTNRPCVAVSRVFTSGVTSTFQVTGTQTISSGTASTSARCVVFREAGAPIAAPVSQLTGFEFGTHAGLAEATVHASGTNQPLGASTATPVGTWGTHYQIGASFARSSDYGFRISTSAATCNVALGTSGSASGCAGLNVRPVSGSGTPTLVTFDVTTGTDLLLVWDPATEQLGLRWGAGSVAWQTGTTPANTWAWVEVRWKVNATTHHAEWWCETGTGDGLQTSPADLTSMTSTGINISLGALGSQTVTVDFDDYVNSAYYAAFPLGSHRVVRLVPEGTGATVSGTSGNFQRFTNNGTLAAVAGTEGALLDECPPTVSASADGVAQVTTAASDYLQIPFQDLTLAADEVIAGVRMIAAMWGGTGSATGTLGLYSWDGTTETTLAPNTTVYDAGSPTAYSATEPLWMAKVWSMGGTGIWTKAKLDAACIRMGKSSDATPDMGMSACYLEVAVKTVPSVRLLTVGESDEFTVDAFVHPYNSAMVALTVTNSDPTLTAEMTYSVSGTPQTPVTVTAGNSTTVDIHADSFGDISDVHLTAS